MKKFLFIHWNILYGDNGYYLSSIQELHIQLLTRYASIFDDVVVALHSRDTHDIVTLHTAKVMFDKIFGNRVSFKIVRYSETNAIDTFERYFIPTVLDNYDEYVTASYINDNGAFEQHTNNIRVLVSSLYYYNFEYFNDLMLEASHLNDTFITGGLLAKVPVENTQYHFIGGFFTVLVKNYRKYYLENGIDKKTLYLAYKSPELHYMQSIDESRILKNTHIGVLECDSMEDMINNNNPNVMMDPIIQRLSNEKDINNTFSLARGEKL